MSRGNSRIVFKKTTVVKTDDASQPLKMRMFPDAFVQVLSIASVGEGRAMFSMPRLEDPNLEDLPEALAQGLQLLKKYLWSQADLFEQPPWREALEEHLLKVGKMFNAARIHALVESLPDPECGRAIHGDPTFANMLYDPHRGWVWTDPLDRAYIPHDPHVDLGKMFQSLWGYEALLMGEISEPSFDIITAHDLTAAAGLDYDTALNWCHIHVIRLIPYQTTTVRTKFIKALEDVGF
jgi:hypothetical protein